MSKPKDDKDVIRLSIDDVSSSATADVVGHLQSAQQVPLVRNVGVESKNYGGLLTLLWMTLAGVGGGLLTWVLWNGFPPPSDSTAANLQASVLLAMGITIVLVAVDSGLTRSWPKVGKAFLIGIPTALVASLILGLLANAFYQSWIETILNDLFEAGLSFQDEGFIDAFNNRNHLGRGIAWSLLGLAAGLGVGVSTLAGKRILVTSIGGLIGGFLGGFLFDFFTGEATAQIIGLIVTGVAIGLGIGLIEQAAKTSWLEIVQGGMAGKQFILYKPTVSLGSSPPADVTLIKDPAIPAFAAEISRRGGAVTLTSLDAGRPVVVNGAAVTKTTLAEGASIELGATVVRYRERSKKEVTAPIVRR
jgi:hypothetical protein